jgi:hypothetical protein
MIILLLYSSFCFFKEVDKYRLNTSLLHDTVGKRQLSTTELTSNLLVGWRNKQGIRLYIHCYSLSMSNKEIYEKMKRRLINPAESDRAGVATMNLQKELVTRLKELHGRYYISSNINWAFWANVILSSPAHQQEATTHSPPPITIAYLFAMNQQNEAVRNQLI